jgi:hypothetical protein
MPRTGVLGQAMRIDPVPADHEALDGLRAREDLGDGELVLRTADGTEIPSRCCGWSSALRATWRRAGQSWRFPLR